MALPVLSKTWQFSVNNSTGLPGTALDINRTWVRTIKDQLLAFASSPWAMRYSCNSVTAGTAGDGVDRITTNANLVWANAGTAHSWYVIRQTGIATNYELLISCENASASGNVLTIVISPSAGFTGGTTTARPTATDELVINNGTWNASGVLAYRWHMWQSTDGQCTRLFTYSSGTILSSIVLDKPGNSVTGWSNPSISMATNGNTALTAAIMGSLTGPFLAKIGATTGVITVSAEGLLGNVANPSFPTNTNWGNIANEVSGEWPMLPLGLICTTATIRGRHGTIQDMWAGSGGANTGDTYPSGSSNQFAQFGALILPWNGTAVQLS